MKAVKFRQLVSKIVIEGNAPGSIEKEILEWAKESKPIVNHKQSWSTSYKGGK